jgi:hypothetical protein
VVVVVGRRELWMRRIAEASRIVMEKRVPREERS